MNKAATDNNTSYLVCGVFLISLALILFQLSLNRILSVVFFYHFAFLSVSMSMLGLAVGAAIVQLFPVRFSAERTFENMAASALAFGIGSVFTLLLLVFLPFDQQNAVIITLSALSFLISSAVTFTAGGICICLALTQIPGKTSLLYAADLIGAATGCFILFLALPLLNGPAVMWLILIFAGTAALFLSRRIQRLSLVITLLALAILVYEMRRPVEESLFRLNWVKGQPSEPPLLERWDNFSRVAAYEAGSVPYTWGLSQNFPSDFRIEQKHFVIDGSASTPITRFDGDFSNLEHLKADIVNISHHLRENADVFVVGVGGGRDLLTALLFNQNKVVGAEINGNMIQALQTRFREFSGHLLDKPEIRVVNDEARSLIGREPFTYDLIQISLVDTWAATASGAFALAENALYTVEAWKQFYGKLNSRGIFSVSRWWNSADPNEALRTLSLARAALEQEGKDPAKHLVLLLNENPKYRSSQGVGVATLLMAANPFSKQEIDKIRELSDRYSFVLALSPYENKRPLLSSILREPINKVSQELDMTLSAPTDSSPFFFNFINWRNILSLKTLTSSSGLTMALLISSTILTIFFSGCYLIRPLIHERQRTQECSYDRHFITYFACIGLGFLFIEIPLIQWLSVFLGHPTYGITVTLAGILFATGLGSAVSKRYPDSSLPVVIVPFVLIACCLGAYFVSPVFRQSETYIRILVSLAVLMPAGIAMGACFPLGMRLLSSATHGAGALMWTANGVASVVAGMLSVVIAILTNIWTTYLLGVCLYFLAALFYQLLRIKLAGNLSDQQEYSTAA